MTMIGPFHPWRDTLHDLGVMGLIPVPLVREAVIEKQPRPIMAQSAQEAVQEKTNLPAATLEDLERGIQGCLACPLGAGRIRFVFGEGSGASGLLFIGEGPGRDEDLKGRPFVGKAGELLDKMLAAIGLERGQVYIANIVKCRPPDNRTPTGPEAQRCLPYLKRQIELLAPRVIVTLGATPLRELLGVQTGITRVRGQWQRLEMLGGIPVMPTFHPAYVLRQYTQEVRRAVWSDLVAAKKWLDDAGTR
jgi:DNA polymerase